MIKINAHDKRAFVNGFIDGFGNVGQIFEPIIDGTSVIKDATEPVIIRIHRSKRNLSFYIKNSSNGRYMMTTGVRRERKSSGK